MKPRRSSPELTDDLFRSRLENIIDLRHELVLLSNKIDWNYLDEKAAVFFSDEGRPAHPTRLMVGLHLLKYMFNLSDESVCARWKENPYYQYFTGETYFQHCFPIERSDMTHWRHRVGEDFCVTLLQESLRLAHETKALRTKDMKKTITDTTVQPKAITYPTEAKLRYKALVKLGEAAKAAGVPIRQSYVRVGKLALIKSSRYRHAKQMKRAKKQEKFLHIRLGRLIRDVERKQVTERMHTGNPLLNDALKKAQQIHQQRCGDADYLYSWHAPEVECIGKGKAHKPYEFGVKVSLMTTVNPAPGGQFILHAKALPGRPFDGHTLCSVLDEMEEQTGIRPERNYVDQGYRGHGVKGKTTVYQSGQRRGVTAAIKKELRRRAVIEPIIGHAKQDCRMDRNYLYGVQGDAMNAVLAAVGFNFRQLLRWFRKLFCFYLQRLLLSVCFIDKIRLRLKTSF